MSLFLGTSVVRGGEAPMNINVLRSVLGNIVLHFTVQN